MRTEVFEEMMKVQAELVDGHEECGGTGYLAPENPGELNPCECMRIHTYVCALIEAKIPKDYWWLAQKELEVEEASQVFLAWYLKRLDNAVENGLGVLFMGPNGVGKTSMQCVIGKEAIVRGFSVQYYTAQQYIEAHKMKDTDLLEEYESSQIVLLDELDKVYVSRGSDFVKRTLEEYLRRMTSEGKVLIICTNGDAEYLGNTFGDSTMSALQRHLKFMAVDGEDFSQRLQDQWVSMMDKGKNYHSPEILDKANRRAERIIEEDRRGWQKTDS